MIRHLSEEEICRAITGQSTLDEQRHVRTCPACGAKLSHWRHTFAAFRHDVRDRAERTTPPVSTLVEANAALVPRGAIRQGQALNPVWGIAATLLVASLALVWQVRHTAGTLPPGELPRRVIATDQTTTITDATVDVTSEFFPLAYSTVPITHARVVRIEVPRTAPALFGIDPAGLVNASPGTVIADVVVGEDGLARAVRFVRLHTSRE